MPNEYILLKGNKGQLKIQQVTKTFQKISKNS